MSSNPAPKINDLHEYQSSFIPCLKDPRVSSYGDDKYLTRPMVFRNPKLELPEEETHNQFHTTIDAASLTTPQAFDYPISHVDFKRQHELDEIFKTQKDLCDTYKLPLVQTWTVSSRSSFVATWRNIELTCSSFNCRCVGKVCMPTTALPFYVHDLHLWSFREVCRKYHFLKSEGVVGRALSSHDSCFCANVTKLEEDEYSLVHDARISGLSSCFAIYMDSREHDDSYVLEFFLPVDMKEGADLQSLVQKLKMRLKLSSFEFGGLITTEVIETPMEASQLSLPMQLRTIWTSLPQETMFQLYSKDSHIVRDTDAQMECNLEDRRVSSKQRRKRKRDSFTRETIHQYFGMPIGKASKCLGVSRSTLKRVCRELEIPSWPLPVRNKKYAHFGICVIVLLLVRVKRWTCSSNRHGFSARWWVCGRHNSFISKSNPSALKGEAIGGLLYAAQPLKESDDSISTLSLRSKSPQARFGIYEAACLLLALKRWRKKTACTHRMSCNDFLIDGHLTYTFGTFCTSPKKNVVNVPDTIMVTVKATYKADMIKFQFTLSSGLLELKNQVAQRFKLKNTKFHLKYRDEDGDLILVACDSDFRDLFPFSTTSVSKNTVKLIVQTAVD